MTSDGRVIDFSGWRLEGPGPVAISVGSEGSLFYVANVWSPSTGPDGTPAEEQLGSLHRIDYVEDEQKAARDGPNSLSLYHGR